MKKVLKLILALSLLLAMTAAIAACGRGDDDELRVALVAHSPDSILNDGSFNEGSWNGIQNFITEHGGERRFFQSNEASDAARVNFMRDAIEDFGADILILPGFHFAGSVYEAQSMFPDARFVILDASPEGPGGVVIAPNTVAVHYAEHESGFLAGYAAVREGYRQLGFLGGIALPPVIRFGHGYVQGAEHAAREMGLAAGEVTIRYDYFGSFQATPENQTLASSWYAAGVEVIFAAAGTAGNSVMSAAAQNNAMMIGVDVDQSSESPTVLTSAMKALEVSVYSILDDHVNDNWRGGRELRFSAAQNGVALPMATSRFQNFTQSQYDYIFNQLATGAVRVNDTLDFNTVLSGLSLVQIQ